MRRGAAPGVLARACAAALVAFAPMAALGQQITAARLTAPTLRYAHGVFGDDTSYGALVLEVTGCAGCADPDNREITLNLPDDRVFEDRQARLADLDGDGQAEVVVVETDIRLGATLAIYDATGKRAATAPVGQTRRWLAPAGIGDFDGDGRVEIAYVDRPHLAKELVFVRYEGGLLTEIARAPGLTNHHYGQAEIMGGLRRCDGRDSLVLASSDGRRTVEVVLRAGAPEVSDRGPASAMAKAMRCG